MENKENDLNEGVVIESGELMARKRTQSGRYRKKRSDTGKKRKKKKGFWERLLD